MKNKNKIPKHKYYITINLPYNAYESALDIIGLFTKTYDVVFMYDDQRDLHHIRPISSYPYIEDYKGNWHNCILYMLNILEKYGQVTYIEHDGTNL